MKRKRKPKRKPTRQCERCKKKFYRLERHHILYDPEVTVKICRKCHKEITERNTLAARSTIPWHKLSNKERAYIWLMFVQEC